MEDKLSLSSLSKEELLETRGGDLDPVCISSTGCTCGCNYSGQGGSSCEDNCRANGELQQQ